MLKRRGGMWEIYPHRVKGMRYGEEFEQWALPDKSWWRAMEDGHENLEISEFKKIEVTDEMYRRHEEVKHMPEDFHGLYIDYVIAGDTSEGIELSKDHPFNIIRLQKRDAAQGQDLTQIEITAMKQGQELSGLEIRLLMMEMR